MDVQAVQLVAELVVLAGARLHVRVVQPLRRVAYEQTVSE